MVKVSTFVALVALTTLGLAPGAQAACEQSLAQTFLDWKDQGMYTLATGGSMESSEGWTLSKAKVVSGNEPWQVNSTEDSHSLRLFSGGTATSPFMCVDVASPYFRVFARNAGATSSKLKVEVLFRDANGATKVKPTAGISLRDSKWRLSRRLGLASGQSKREGKAGGPVEAAFRFSPMDSAGRWRIDDLYVDPRRR